MSSLGYAREGSEPDSLKRQVELLRETGVERIFEDRLMSSQRVHPGMAALIDYVREGDTVTVVTLDRLGRSLAGIVQAIEELSKKGATLLSIRDGMDNSTVTGRMVTGILGSLAEYDRLLIQERAALAGRSGAKPGRPPVLSDDQARKAREMRSRGESVEWIVQQLGASRATVYRALKDQ